jgi:hypothetical protein
MLKTGSMLLHQMSTRLVRRYHPEWHCRRWSNEELRPWGLAVSGDIINVSGWRDSDKNGREYKDYFVNKRLYAVSNVGGARGSDADTTAEQLRLDLTQPIDAGLRNSFDVVFNHTTLEHVFNIQVAASALATLTRDLLMVVVPAKQDVHTEPESYLDYWRPTHFALSALFTQAGLTTVYCSRNVNPVFTEYLFLVASRHPARWTTTAATIKQQRRRYGTILVP